MIFLSRSHYLALISATYFAGRITRALSSNQDFRHSVRIHSIRIKANFPSDDLSVNPTITVSRSATTQTSEGCRYRLMLYTWLWRFVVFVVADVTRMRYLSLHVLNKK